MDTSELEFVQKKLDMFEEVGRIIESTRHLSNSLQSLSKLSETTDSMPVNLLKLVELLSDEQAKLTTPRVEIRLEAIDNKIRDNLSELLVPNIVVKYGPGDLEKVIKEFKRVIYLAIAFRVLLCERGEDFIPFELDVAPDLLKTHIRMLKNQKSKLTNKLVAEMKEFAQEVAVLQDSAPTSEMKEVMESVIMAISCNIDHLENGKPFDEIPNSFQSIGIFSSKPEEVKTPEVPEVIEEEIEELDTQLETMESGSFLDNLNDWLSTPTNVSWNQIKKKNK